MRARLFPHPLWSAALALFWLWLNNTLEPGQFLLGLLLGWYGLQYVLYGAIAGHLLALAVAIATCVHERKLQLSYSFGPPLIAGALAVVLLQA